MTSTTAWRFAHGAGAVLVKRQPEAFTQEFIKADRAGRILVDTGRNGAGATFAAVYAVRPKPGAPVSAPCTWEEVERGAVGPRTFTLRTMRDRIREVGDLWAGMNEKRVSLRRAAGGAGALADGAGLEDAWPRRRDGRRRGREGHLRTPTLTLSLRGRGG